MQNFFSRVPSLVSRTSTHSVVGRYCSNRLGRCTFATVHKPKQPHTIQTPPKPTAPKDQEEDVEAYTRIDDIPPHLDASPIHPTQSSTTIAANDTLKALPKTPKRRAASTRTQPAEATDKADERVHHQRTSTSHREVDHMSWVHLLEKIRVNQLVPKTRPVIQVKSDEPVTTVITKLAESNVHGAVVMNEDDHPIGFVDVLDILTDVIKESNMDRKAPVTRTTIIELFKRGRHFASQTCGKLVNVSGRDPFTKIGWNDFLIEATRTLTNAHHAAVVTSKGNLINVMSQIDVVNFLLEHHNSLGSRFDQPLLEAGLTPDSVVGQLSEDVTVIGALRYMHDCEISGVAIVDKLGKIVTNFSATDLLGFGDKGFPLLALPVKEFVKEMAIVRQGPVWQGVIREPISHIKPPVTCKLTDTVEVVMLKLSHYKVHRLYVVDEHHKPIGFLSLTDIMKYVSQPLP